MAAGWLSHAATVTGFFRGTELAAVLTSRHVGEDAEHRVANLVRLRIQT